tara:strand:- start:459 stop:674 length:216 start_codon:yes stop_codon:yes gene_type:complete
MSKNKKPTTIRDIIQQGRQSNTYDELSPSDRIKYLTIYVNKNKDLNKSQHEAVLGMTDEEFFKQKSNEVTG